MKKFKAFLVALVAMLCFTVNAGAQKVSMTVADQHYAAQTGFYKRIMIGLALSYVLYLAFRHYRGREINRYMGFKK